MRGGVVLEWNPKQWTHTSAPSLRAAWPTAMSRSRLERKSGMCVRLSAWVGVNTHLGTRVNMHLGSAYTRLGRVNTHLDGEPLRGEHRHAGEALHGRALRSRHLQPLGCSGQLGTPPAASLTHSHSLTLTHSLTCSAASTSRGSGTRRKAMSTAAGSLPLVSSTTLSNVIGTTCARQPQASEFVLTSKQLLLQGASHGEVESELERGSL